MNEPSLPRGNTRGDYVVICDCSDIAPTMPTFRDHHLYDCPIAVHERVAAFQQKTPEMQEQFERIAELMRAGDTSGVAEILKQDSKAQAEAAYLRMRARTS